MTASSLPARAVSADEAGERRIQASSAGGSCPRDYTIVLIPDTQYLSQDHPQHFDALSHWIADNKDTRNIELVLHLGDIVNDGDDLEQWEKAAGPLDLLYGLGIPMVTCVGNHDHQGDIGDRDTTHYNDYVGLDRYLGSANSGESPRVPWFDGDFLQPDRSDNLYLRVDLGGRPTLVLVLEFFPRKAVMAWADQVIEAHPGHEVTVLTHAYLSNDGVRTRDGDPHGPATYPGIATDAMSGQRMWDEHLRHHPNIVAVYNGHHITGPNIAHRCDDADPGNRVFQQFANWQKEPEGGEGRIVLHTVAASTGATKRQVYNAARERFEEEYELTVPGRHVGR